MGLARTCGQAAVGTRGDGALRERRVPRAGSKWRHPPDTSIKWKVGDKARHGKWGVGTVVSVKGSGEEVELKIASRDRASRAHAEVRADCQGISQGIK